MLGVTKHVGACPKFSEINYLYLRKELSGCVSFAYVVRYTCKLQMDIGPCYSVWLFLGISWYAPSAANNKLSFLLFQIFLFVSNNTNIETLSLVWSPFSGMLLFFYSINSLIWLWPSMLLFFIKVFAQMYEKTLCFI